MGWITTKDGRHVNTDWFDRENNIMSNKHDHLNALREAKTKDEVMGVIKSAGNKLTGKALEDVMSAAHDKAQEMKKDEKEKQIEANKKEAEKKNAEEKKKDSDKQKPNWIADKDNAKQYKTQGVIPAKKSAEEVLGLGKNSLKIVEKSRSAIDTEYALVHKETNQEVGRVLEGNTSKGAKMWLYKIKKNK